MSNTTTVSIMMPVYNADAIIALCMDDTRRRTLGRRGRELAGKKLSWKKVAQGYQELYEGRFDNQYRWHKS